MDIVDLVKVFCENVVLLNDDQKKECLDVLFANQSIGDDTIPACVAEAKPSACPCCGHNKLGKWGYASGIRRWICKECNKTFNILTGTPLARLRHKEKWLTNAEAMINAKTTRAAANDCGVHRNTAFRWRHRFLQLHDQSQQYDIKGVAESDATYFYFSEKGSKNLKRRPAKRGGDGIGPGISKDLVPVITLRDRLGNGADRVAEEHVQMHAIDLYKTHLADDTLLITSGDKSLCAAGVRRNPEAHIDLTGKASRGKAGSPYHTQTTNAFHSNLKSWMRRFNGVATKYLANYIGWHRHLFEQTYSKNPNLFIQLAFNPLGVSQQLTVT